MALHHGSGKRRPGRDGRRRLLGSLLALALLSMPVSYRAGTDVSHAHAYLLFLADAALGATNHHVRWSGAASHRGQAPAETVDVVTSAPAGTPILEALGPANERATGVGLVLLLLVTATVAGRPVLVDSSAELRGIGPRPPVPRPRPTPALA